MTKPTPDDLRKLLTAVHEVVRGSESINRAHQRGELSPLGKYEQKRRVVVLPGAPAEYDLVGVVIPTGLAERLSRALAPFIAKGPKKEQP